MVPSVDTYPVPPLWVKIAPLNPAVLAGRVTPFFKLLYVFRGFVTVSVRSLLYDPGLDLLLFLGLDLQRKRDSRKQGVLL